MLYVTRHGQTGWNALDKVLGRTDIPLDEKGMEQARELARSLKDTEIDEIRCSPLMRTRQTGESVSEATGIGYTNDDRRI